MKLNKETKVLFFQNILPALLVSIIGIITVFVNISYTNKLSMEAYYENINIQQKLKMLDERIKLIGDLSKLLGMKAGIIDIWNNYKNSIKVTNNKVSVTIPDSEKLLKYNADYYSILIKIGLYFGPETKKILLEFNNEKGPWWKKNDNTFNKLLETMIKELKYGL